jgi:hypothetical protein
MDLWIRFIGLILLYQSQPGGTYQAIIPKWDHDTFCGHAIVKHVPFIRVTNSPNVNNVLDASQWPEKKDCPEDLHCTVFAIPDDTTLSISQGFASAQQTTTSLPCLVPDFRRERLISQPGLHPEALTTRSAATFNVPNGQFFADQFDNAAIVIALRVPAPTSANSDEIRITATPRNDPNGSRSPHVLVLKAGTVVDIINVPEGQEMMSYDAPDSHDDDPRSHFFFLHKLLTIASVERDCNFFPANVRGECEGQRHRRMKAVQRDAEGRILPETGAESTHGVGCGPAALPAAETNLQRRRR